MTTAPPPSDWLPDRDLLVIMGTGAEAQAEEHLRAGLHRVLAIVPEGLAAAAQTPAQVVRTQAGLKPYVWSNNVSLRRISVRLTPDGGVDQDTARQWLTVLSQIAEQHRSFHATMAHLGPLWASNGIANASAVAANPMIGDFSQTFRGVPLIVVGAGPSLASNIAQIKAAKGKAIVLALHRTLESLHRAGIAPDLTIAVEPRDVSHQYTGVGADKLAASILSTAVHPSLEHTPIDRTIHYTSQGREEWLLAPEDRQHEAVSLGTVSHSAVSLARAWGCDPIILVGQDLAFPDGAIYHADGADGDTRLVRDEASGQWKMEGYSAERKTTLAEAVDDPFDVVEIEGYNGGTVVTSTSFNDFRLTLEQMARDWSGETTLINATEGGAKISGWQQAPLASTLAALPGLQLDVDARLEADTQHALISARGERTQVIMTLLHQQLTQVVKLSKQCVKLIEQCLASPNPQRLAKLETVENALKAEARKIAPLTLATQHDLTLIVSRSPEIKSLQDSLRLSRDLYAMIGREAARLLSVSADR